MTYDIRLWDKTKTNRDNATTLGVTPEHARSIAIANGLKYAPGHHGNNTIFDISKWAEDKTPQENARIQKVGLTTIYKKIKEHGLKCKILGYKKTNKARRIKPRQNRKIQEEVYVDLHRETIFDSSDVIPEVGRGYRGDDWVNWH